MRVAAVQAAPEPSGTNATIHKLRHLVDEARDRGAGLIAFGESFIPGYPYWAWTSTPLDAAAFCVALEQHAVTVPGPTTAELSKIANRSGCVLVIGVTERIENLRGTLYNTVLIFDEQGVLRGRHRKLVPTFAERLVWGGGDGRGLCVHSTAAGRVGALICGENTNPLARYALHAQGEDLHVALFPSFPFAGWYREADAIEIRCRAHAFEGKSFVVAACTLPDECTREELAIRAGEHLTWERHAMSAVWGPTGSFCAEPLIDVEGVVYADIAVADRIAAKLMHDIVGSYNQHHVLSLRLDRSRAEPISFSDRSCRLPEVTAHWLDDLSPDA